MIKAIAINYEPVALNTIDILAQRVPFISLECIFTSARIALNYLAKENKRYQFGYVIIKDLVCLFNANMKVESVLNIGTSVTIRLSDL